MSECSKMCFRTSAAHLQKLACPRRPAGANASSAAQRVAEEHPHVGFYLRIIWRHAAPACHEHPFLPCSLSDQASYTAGTLSIFTAAEAGFASAIYAHPQKLRTSCLRVQGECGMVHAAVTHASLHKTHWRWLHTCAAQYLAAAKASW